MFADVGGFTAISEKLDPEDVHRIMDGCCRILVAYPIFDRCCT
jgi:class 3 adenylate cyclase